MIKTVAYDFYLRADFLVTLILPDDITATEATQLCNFILMIPLSVRLAIIRAEQERLTDKEK